MLNLNLRLVGEGWPLKYNERFRVSLGSGRAHGTWLEMGSRGNRTRKHQEERHIFCNAEEALIKPIFLLFPEP